MLTVLFIVLTAALVVAGAEFVRSSCRRQLLAMLPVAPAVPEASTAD